MAALLVLRKKWRAFCSEDAEKLTRHAHGGTPIELIREAMPLWAQTGKRCAEIGISLRTLRPACS